MYWCFLRAVINIRLYSLRHMRHMRTLENEKSTF